MTDDLRRRLRAARPVPGDRNDPLSDRATRELAALLSSDPAAPATPSPSASGSRPSSSRPTPTGPTRRRRSGRWLALAATVVVAVSVGVLWPTSSPAQAFPQPLVVEPLVEQAGSPVAELALVAAKNGEPTPDGDVHLRWNSWSLSIEEVDGEMVLAPDSRVSKIFDLTIREDGSLSQVVTAGESYALEGEDVEGDVVEAGTVLSELEQGPGTLQPLFEGPAPVDPDLVEAFFTDSGWDVTGSASDVFLAISSLLMEQRLDGAQTSALLTYLSTVPDYKIAGTTTDRLDRPALMLTALRADAEYSDQLLIDRETGEILAFETVYIGSTRTDITAPTVTEYLAWKD